MISDDPKPKPRAKFVLIDPLAIDKRLLYEIGGRYFIGLILSTERNAKTGKLVVQQAMPSALYREGKHRAPVVGNWHVLREAWTKKERPGSTPASQKS
jgi:hypothetical protein